MGEMTVETYDGETGELVSQETVEVEDAPPEQQQANDAYDALEVLADKLDAALKGGPPLTVDEEKQALYAAALCAMRTREGY